MVDVFKHGVYISRLANPRVQMRSVPSAIPFIVGSAPGAADGSLPVNQTVFCNNLGDFERAFGWTDNMADFTLVQAAWVLFGLFGMGPAIFVNVADSTQVTDEAQTVASNAATLDNAPIVPTSEVVTDTAAGTTYVRGTDYTIDNDTGILTRLTGGSMGETEGLKISYKYVDASAVTADDIIGGSTAGVNTGLFLIEDAYTRHRMLPTLVLAPGWSHQSTVGQAMIARAQRIDGVYSAWALLDLPETVTDPTLVGAQKTTLSYTDKRCVPCWPRMTLGDDTYWASLMLAGSIMETDYELGGGVPYYSPSNQRLPIDGLGDGLLFNKSTANNNLGANGIWTAINTDKGWVGWGDWTGAHPAATAPEDKFIAVGRMFDWVGNTFALTYLSKVDFPPSRRKIEGARDSGNRWLNGLMASEALLGGEFLFLEDDNPLDQISDGKLVFRQRLTPPSPAAVIEILQEYDINNIRTLFG